MKKIICIDAGHGGTDSGACGNGIKEKDLVLKVAKAVKNELSKQNFDVVCTRITDNFVNLGERCRIANSHNANLFVSIHANSASNPQANGIETLCYSKNKISEILQKNLVNSLKLNNRGIKERKDLFVLNGTKMEAALVELGFLSSKIDSSIMRKNNFETISANAIVNAICEYFGINQTQENEKKENWEMKKIINVTINGKQDYTEGYFANNKNLFTTDFIKKLGFDVEYNPASKVVSFKNSDVKTITAIINGKQKELSSIFRNNLNHITLQDLKNLGLLNVEYKNGIVYINSK